MFYDVSVIVPVFNGEKTISRCIRSIELQKTKYNFQLVVVDDGSTDNSLKIVNRLSKEFNNIKVLTQQNLKQAHARNLGLMNSLSQYVMFADCDDIMLPGMVENMVSRMNLGNDLVMCEIKKVYTNHTEIEKGTFLKRGKSQSNLISIYLRKNKEFDVGLWNKVFKRSVIEDNNICFTNENFFEDSLFVLEYLLAIDFRKISFINKPFYCLFKTNESTTTSFHKEIDSLSEQYINNVCYLLDNSNVKISKNEINAFKLRIRLHVVHHHIKYDKSWNARAQKKAFGLSWYDHLVGCMHLSLKYLVAEISARLLPHLYIWFYGRKYCESTN